MCFTERVKVTLQREVLRCYLLPLLLVPLALWGPWVVGIYLFLEDPGNAGLPLNPGFWLAIPTYAPIAVAGLLTDFNATWFPIWMLDFLSNSFGAIVEGKFSLYHAAWGAFTLSLVGAMIYLGARGRWWLVWVVVVALAMSGYPVFEILALKP